jgi:hypothetical protein
MEQMVGDADGALPVVPVGDDGRLDSKSGRPGCDVAEGASPRSVIVNIQSLLRIDFTSTHTAAARAPYDACRLKYPAKFDQAVPGRAYFAAEHRK